MMDEKKRKKEKKTKEVLEQERESDYQNAVELMEAIQCMSSYKNKIDMYLTVVKRFEQLSDYKDSKELAKECNQLALLTKEEVKAQAYKDGKRLLKQAKTKDEYMDARTKFQKIHGYLDADNLAKKCEESISLLEKKSENKKLLTNTIIVLVILTMVLGMKSTHGKYYLGNILQLTHAYNPAIKFYNRTIDFKDSRDRISQCEYQNGIKAMAAKDYKNAQKAFESAGYYKDSDAKKVVMEKESIKNSEVGDTINIGEKRWRILEIQDNQAFLLKDPPLPNMAYSIDEGAVTWEQSSLRRWLNSEYLEDNFTKAEKNNIVPTSVKNEKNSFYGTDGGNDTQDYIYLLSIEEISRYNELIPNSKHDSWLRSPGNQQNTAAFLSTDGIAMVYGYEATSEDFKLMPVMWFDLD